MKPKRLAFITSIAVSLSAVTAEAANINKGNNTDDLNLTTSWVGGVAPTASDVALWDATVTGANSVSLGADPSWQGIKITNPAGPVTINAGNTLTLVGGITNTIDMATAIQNLTLDNAVLLGADQAWNVAPGIKLAANGAVSGTGKLTKSNNGGKLTLTGTNTYTGGTAILGGILSFANGSLGTTGAITVDRGVLQWAPGNTQDISSRLAFNTTSTTLRASTFDTNGNDVTFGSVIAGADRGNLIKRGAGTLTLTAENTYTGGTSVQEGTLNLDYTGGDTSRLADTGTPTAVTPVPGKLTFKGGTLNLSGGAHTEVVAATELFSDTSPLGGSASTLTRSSGASVLQMNTISRNNNKGGTINFAAENIATADNILLNGILGGWATVAGTDWATSAGTDDSLITANTAYAANEWSFETDNNVTVTADNDLTALGSVFANSLRFNAPEDCTVTFGVGSTNVLTSGGILMTNNAGASTITGGTLTCGQDMVIHQYSTSKNLTISSVISGTAVALTKSGPGKLILTAVDTHGGGTYINAGVVTLQAAVPTGNMFNSAGGRVYITPGAALELDNCGLDSTGKAINVAGMGIANDGAIRNIFGNNALGGTITLNGDTRIRAVAGTLTLKQAISGTADLFVDGDGTVVLSHAANTYTGATHVNAGTLLVNGGTAAVSAVTVDAPATLGGTGTVAGRVSVSGKLAPGLANAVGTLTTGNVTFNATGEYVCTINGVNSDKLVAGNLNVNAAAKVTISGTPTVTGYLIATYTGTEPTHFDESSLTPGYTLDYTTPGEIWLVEDVGSGTPFETWAAGPPCNLSGNDALPGADPDNDGVKNIAEFALGGNPNDAAANGASQAKLQDVSGIPALTYTFLTRIGTTFDTGSGPRAATMDGVTYSVQGGQDLSDWTATITEVTPAIITGMDPAPIGYEYHTFKTAGPVSSTARDFIRVQVTGQ